jgi:hypothetical protein
MGPFTAARVFSVLETVLAGMLAAGFGIDFISLALGLTSTEIFRHIGHARLELPPAKSIRKAGGRAHWHPDEVQRLIALWLAGVNMSSIGASLGRSRSSLYYKKRRLGLPTRSRRGLRALSPDDCARVNLPWTRAVPEANSAPGSTAPAQQHLQPHQQPAATPDLVTTPPSSEFAEPTASDPDPITASPEALAAPLDDVDIIVAAPPVQHTASPIVVYKPTPVVEFKTPAGPKTQPGRRTWTMEKDERVAELGFANLHPDYIAEIISREFQSDTSPGAVVCRLSRLEVKRGGRKKKYFLLTACDLADVPRLAAERRRELGAKARMCIKLNRLFFTYPGDLRQKCREYMRAKKYAEARSIDDAIEAMSR